MAFGSNEAGYDEMQDMNSLQKRGEKLYIATRKLLPCS